MNPADYIAALDEPRRTEIAELDVLAELIAETTAAGKNG